MAKPTVLINNEKVKVTEWYFEVGDSTGTHIHEYDYVVVPMMDGELKVVDKDNHETISKLTKGGSYFREKGVNHNVFNNNDYPYSFIEIEMIK
jgi:mannose-6-phosphate isomerase-like protein (cupin superfamily)